VSKTKPAASSGSLLFDVLAHNLDLPLQQLCTLSCASSSTRKMLRDSLQQRSKTYPVSFRAKKEDEVESFTAWWVSLAAAVQGAATGPGLEIILASTTLHLQQATVCPTTVFGTENTTYIMQQFAYTIAQPAFAAAAAAAATPGPAGSSWCQANRQPAAGIVDIFLQ
jgi:hypothetical protein